jgi:hypothetical protein
MKKEKITDQKLREILEKSNSGQSFQVPQGYFEALPNTVMDRINSLPDFSTSSLENSNPFEVPAHYFEHLSVHISDRIAATNQPKSWLKRALQPIIYAPAMLSAAMVIFGFIYFNRQHTFTVDQQSCSVEDLNTSGYIESMNETDLIDFLAEQSSDKDTKESKESGELDEYLLDNNIDISQLEKSL